MRMSLLFCFLLLLISGTLTAGDLYQPDIRYAQGFSVKLHSTYYEVITHSSSGSVKRDNYYYLIPRNSQIPRELRGKRVIPVPIGSFVTMSTTYIPFVILLQYADHLVGHDTLDYIFSPPLLEKARQGEIREVGSGSRVNRELLIQLNPEAIFTYSVGLPDWDALPILEKAGLPVVLTTDQLENDPLGRAEWIKFFALFFGKEEEAERIFKEIETDYLEEKRKASSVNKRPTVLLNNPWQGTWFVPAGSNYMARIISDAGGKYLWEDLPGTGSVALSFESILAKGESADLWLNVSWRTLLEARNSDSRVSLFRAFQKGEVFNLLGRTNSAGANDFYETGVARPDLVLRDLISVFHPDKLPGHTLLYLKRVP